MYRRRQTDVLRITLIATLTLAVHCLCSETSSANAGCKMTMLRFILKKCMINRKIKRDAMSHDLENSDYKRGNDADLIDVPELDGDTHKVRQKRQLPSGWDADVSMTTVSEDSRDALGVNGHAAPRKRYYETGYRPGLGGPQDSPESSKFLRGVDGLYEGRRVPRRALQRFFGASARHPRSFRQGLGTVSSFSPSVSEDLLGFDLSTEELDEIYNEIYERQPRDFDETVERLLHAAMKCCQNHEACKKDPNYISCSKI